VAGVALAGVVRFRGCSGGGDGVFLSVSSAFSAVERIDEGEKKRDEKEG
jgi:hypothetical protein